MSTRKKKSSSIIEKERGRNDTILTLRIDKELNDIIYQLGVKKKLSKSIILRNYLELARYFNVDYDSMRSLNENELIITKRNFLFNLLEELDELKQIDYGSRLAQYINDIARIQGKEDDIGYKLDLCEKHGFFPKFIDKRNYILISKKFGPKKFVEAFTWLLITKGEEGDFDRSFIESEISKSSKTKRSYFKIINPLERDASYYSFEFAKYSEE
ncbi:MAG: hypothetical protein ACTSXH_00385 [Promethearchaeota archaeon]